MGKSGKSRLWGDPDRHNRESRSAYYDAVANKMGDRFLAVILGHTVGDVLGMPYEFSRKKSQDLENYDGLPHTTVRNTRQGRRETALGQGSDDTQMAIALLATIVRGRGEYSAELAAQAYLDFTAHSAFLGKNTRELFGGIKTTKTYYERHAARFPSGGDWRKWSQGNGHLMRAYPLVLCPGSAEADCSLTNPAPICIAWTKLYIHLLQAVLAADPEAYDPAAISASVAEKARELAESSGDPTLFVSVMTPVIPDVRGETKGWSRHALHLAYLCAVMDIGSFAEGIRNVVGLGGDTDTNGAICGAVLGARFGLERMRAEPSVEAVIRAIETCDTETGDYPIPPHLTTPYALHCLYPQIPATAVADRR
jgi:ADP-ribosyl-[dinitrogen reductase] hydrolase